MQNETEIFILNRPRPQKRGLTLNKNGRITLRSYPVKLLGLQRGDKIVFFCLGSQMYITVGYSKKGAHTIASDLNATAQPGTLTCLIGHNGTGKSTLLRTIARLQPSIDGSVLIGDNDISTLKPTHLSRMLSIVLTSRPDVRNMTVEELVALGRAPYTGFWGRLSADDRRIVRHSIESVGITAMAERRVCTLSDGEMQKVMIAKSLAQQTPVILLDEPTAFLDFPGKIDLMLLLQRLAHEERKTILLSTHDLETALQTADRLWLLADGALHDGTPHELADQGFIDDYIGRKSVKFDKQTLSIQIL